MTANGYAITISLFSLAYFLFEVPSNWVMKHYVRPSLWLAFLLFCWGAPTVVVLRFLIGAFEAGFFPSKCVPYITVMKHTPSFTCLGIVYFITIWYRFNERALRIAYVVAFCNLTGAFGGTIAYGIGHINGAGGLQG